MKYVIYIFHISFYFIFYMIYTKRNPKLDFLKQKRRLKSRLQNLFLNSIASTIKKTPMSIEHRGRTERIFSFMQEVSKFAARAPNHRVPYNKNMY